MKKNLWMILLTVAGMGCKQQPAVLYQSEAFSVYADRIIQDDYVGIASSATHLISNYRSTASQNFSRLITFKFSINEKDNELPSGLDRWIIIGGESTFHRSSPLERQLGRCLRIPETNYRLIILIHSGLI
ncbi:MAG: hypothetical protein V2B15_14190 [Bacteroidota bacterium]